LQHVGKFSPGGAVADFLSLAPAIIAGLPRRKGDGTLVTFYREVNRRKRACKNCPRARNRNPETGKNEHEQEHEHDYEAQPANPLP
jgi:hypothetical protein